MSSAFDKAKLFAKNVSKISDLNESGTTLSVFPSKTDVMLYHIFVTPKMIKKIIRNFHFSKASGPDGVAVVVVRNCGPERSCILAEVFNLFLEKSCFPDG